ncbi:vacuolar ATP synthase proteolipid subunit [Perkinsela sp. CCAP 1560/4]|nr:vacuolar ATP synthase proteolipid subunit [Perkinsela sp. CCAP 1560/4]|eukprot:KNH08705.1 vacuolar ATP synthase proteolipid subunit [Perkinsela sp. CCAP 1560/4]
MLDPDHPCAPIAVLFGQLGVTFAIVLSSIGAAYGTAKTGIAVARLGVHKPSAIMKGFIPIIMAGILGIYGLIVAVLINNNVSTDGKYTLFASFIHLGAGLSTGACSLVAGYAIGRIGDTCARSFIKEEKLFTGMILMLIFAEAIGLYGVIMALLMNNTAKNACVE